MARLIRAGWNASASREAFAAMLASENHTLKRALTDPHLFSGIGNAVFRRDTFSGAAFAGFADAADGGEAIDRLYQATRGR